MRDCGYAMVMDLGVSREMVVGMQAQDGTEPDLVEAGERFIVRLHR